MTKWHLMIVGLLALVAAVLVGLNWTTATRTADRETEQEEEQVETEPQRSAEESEETRSAMQEEIQQRCEKLVAGRVAEDTDEADIEEACACAAEEIHSEFEDELPDIVKAGNAEPETEERMDEIVNECVQSAGLELE